MWYSLQIGCYHLIKSVLSCRNYNFVVKELMEDNTFISSPQVDVTSPPEVNMIPPPTTQPDNSAHRVESFNSTGGNPQATSVTPSADGTETHEEDSNKSRTKVSIGNILIDLT